MRAMILERPGEPLRAVEMPTPTPGHGQVRVKVAACGVCRTDLHVVDGDLPEPRLPLVPGHEIVGIVEAHGAGVAAPAIGRRVGIPWLGHTCGRCDYCASGAENLCDRPVFTGYTRDGGFASHTVADAAFAFPLDGLGDPVAAAPLLCAGLIGWRSLKKAGDGRRVGLYGFGAAAHILAQVLRWQGRRSMRSAWALPGPAARKSGRPSRSTPPSCSRRSVGWCRSRSRPCARAAAWCAAVFT
jgi:alcohol dehydrogenase, propanol-preferring